MQQASTLRCSARCVARHPLKIQLMRSYLPSVIAILICGIGGAYFAWNLVDALGWTGVAGAIVTAIIGMIAATLLWSIGVVVRKAVGLGKKR
jgi:hypothetical protein